MIQTICECGGEVVIGGSPFDDKANLICKECGRKEDIDATDKLDDWYAEIGKARAKGEDI